MHASLGVHGGPKWKHEPAPLLVHVKYSAGPGWNTHVSVGHPMSGTATLPAVAGVPPVGAGLRASVAGGGVGVVGPVGPGLLPPLHAARATAKTTWLTRARTRWL